ncbi:glutathione S-transferase II [Diaporthe helianthi]|uniref:glutathione transferase n=1 Tax=Diaporthe helianthi TaxID=158607 RepID=A0A2P5HI53_DIAHE|nr:glutathione S-transferase II [Diaporthe helianthi]
MQVIVVLEEFGVPYEIEAIKFENIKKEPFISVNPNGRVPAIEDPNTGITLGESGAILSYLIKHYDTKNRFSYEAFKERTLCEQWLAYQISGQGPYFGQCICFTYLHPEKIPSAIERYADEIKRVLGVLDGVLAAKPKDEQWLVGDRMTYEDLAFVPFRGVFTRKGMARERAWSSSRLGSRPRRSASGARLLDEQGFDANGMPKGTKSFQDYEASTAVADQASASNL